MYMTCTVLTLFNNSLAYYIQSFLAAIISERDTIRCNEWTNGNRRYMYTSCKKKHL